MIFDNSFLTHDLLSKHTLSTHGQSILLEPKTPVLSSSCGSDTLIFSRIEKLDGIHDVSDTIAVNKVSNVRVAETIPIDYELLTIMLTTSLTILLPLLGK